jgi:hypothetical protein
VQRAHTQDSHTHKLSTVPVWPRSNVNHTHTHTHTHKPLPRQNALGCAHCCHLVGRATQGKREVFWPPQRPRAGSSSKLEVVLQARHSLTCSSARANVVPIFESRLSVTGCIIQLPPLVCQQFDSADERASPNLKLSCTQPFIMHAESQHTRCTVLCVHACART